VLRRGGVRRGGERKKGGKAARKRNFFKNLDGDHKGGMVHLVEQGKMAQSRGGFATRTENFQKKVMKKKNRPSKLGA